MLALHFETDVLVVNKCKGSKNKGQTLFV